MSPDELSGTNTIKTLCRKTIKVSSNNYKQNNPKTNVNALFYFP